MPIKIKINQLQPILKVEMQQNLVPFLLGDPGIGKSATLKALAKEINTKIFILSINQIATREDLTGARSQKDEKTGTYRQVFFPHAIIQDAIDYAKGHPTETPILFLDEINRTSADVTSAVMALITERRIGTTNLPNNIRLVIAGNDKGNVNTMDAASTSRTQAFHVKPDLNYFYQVEPDLNPYIKQVLNSNPKLLVQMPSEDDLDDSDDDSEESNNLNLLNDMNEGIQQITVPRTLHYLSKILNAYKLDGKSLPQNIDEIYNIINDTGEKQPLQNIINGTIGETETGQKLYEVISKSINELASKNNTDSGIKFNKEIKNALFNNVSSDDELSEFFKQHGKTISSQELLDSYLNLIQTNNYTNIKYPIALNKYYNAVVKILSQDHELQKDFYTKFSNLLRDQKIVKPVLDHITNQSDDCSNYLSNTIQVFS